MAGNPRVRRACADDLEQLCRLYVAFHEFHVQGLPERLRSLGEPAQFDCATLVATLEQLLARPDAALFVASEGAEVLGLAELYLRQDAEHNATVVHRYGHLQSLMVREEEQRRRVGTLLLDAAECWAASQGAEELRLDVWEFADGPTPFYERRGYRTLRRTLVRPLPPPSSDTRGATDTSGTA
jgi:GNAT superfamily N-acetyltransferase